MHLMAATKNKNASEDTSSKPPQNKTEVEKAGYKRQLTDAEIEAKAEAEEKTKACTAHATGLASLVKRLTRFFWTAKKAVKKATTLLKNTQLRC